jgi:hypothetical protein
VSALADKQGGVNRCVADPEDKKRLKALVESVRKKVPFATRWRIADNFGNKAECEVT